MTHPNPAREVLIRFECREQCAEKGEPPCFEMDEREGIEGLPLPPCDLCQRLTDARLAALAEAELPARVKNEVEAVQLLQAEWGPLYDLKIAHAARAARHFGGQEFIDWLNESGNGNRPELVRAFAKIGAVLFANPAASEPEQAQP